MKNSKLRRVLMLMACAVLLVCLSVGATLAYLTSTTDVVQNTFTVGNVAIKLDEAALNDYNPTSNEYTPNNDVARVTENKYHMVPGVKMAKDPTVTVLANSENCYVRALVTITYRADADTVIPKDFWSRTDGDWIIGYDATKWVSYANGYSVEEYVETVDEKEINMIKRTYELRYHAEVAKPDEDTPLPDIFTAIKLPDNLTNKQIEALTGLKIDVVAHAIQAQGFANADGAWEVWNEAAKDSKEQ